MRRDRVLIVLPLLASLAVLFPIAKAADEAAPLESESPARVYHDGALIDARLKMLPEHAAGGLDRESLPELYTRAIVCTPSPDSSLYICVRFDITPVVGEPSRPPMYRGMDICWMAPYAPEPFTSVEQVLAAVDRGEIAIDDGGRVYVCVFPKTDGGEDAFMAKQDSPRADIGSWSALKAIYR